jgi:hypothetical protein
VNRFTLSHNSVTYRVSPEVSSTAFDAQPSDLPPAYLMDMGFAIIRSLTRHRRPLIRFFVRLLHSLLHTGLPRRTGLSPPGCRSCSAHDKGLALSHQPGNKQLVELLEGEAEAKLAVERARNGNAAGIDEILRLHESSAVGGIVIVVAKVGAIGQVERLEEELHVVAFFPADVLGSAHVELKEVGSAHGIVTDLLTGTRL